MGDRKPILCLDFDGVLHSYTSGWKGAAVIPDPPVPGAISFLLYAAEQFEVAILSSRSHQWGGRRAMKRWLRRWIIFDLHDTIFKNKPSWVQVILSDEDVFGHGSMDRLDQAVAKRIMKRISFPRYKPPAHLTIDDRAICFTGYWPDPEALLEFKPWNKRGDHG